LLDEFVLLNLFDFVSDFSWVVLEDVFGFSVWLEFEFLRLDFNVLLLTEVDLTVSFLSFSAVSSFWIGIVTCSCFSFITSIWVNFSSSFVAFKFLFSNSFITFDW
jgi:hypothetical protein